MKPILTPNTQRVYRQSLRRFGQYLVRELGKREQGNLAEDLGAWRGITWQAVQGFRDWLIEEGYAPDTINITLTAVRMKAKDAFDADLMDREEWAMIRMVEGVAPRRKRGPRRLSRQQIEKLVDCPNRYTAQGRRDRVMLRLLCRLGLRRSEAIALRVEDINLESDTVTVHREKTHSVDRMCLRVYDLREELQSYLRDIDADAGPLLRRSYKGGKLCESGMSGEALYQRVKKIGARVGIEGLRPHDLRHYLRTSLEEERLPESEIMKAMGHRTLAGSRRYGYGTGNNWSNMAVARAWKP